MNQRSIRFFFKIALFGIGKVLLEKSLTTKEAAIHHQDQHWVAPFMGNPAVGRFRISVLLVD